MDTASIEAFDKLLEYLPYHKVLICKKCRFAIQPSAISNHLKRHQLYRDRRKRLLSSVAELPLAEPQDVASPSPGLPAISALPVYNGYTCLEHGCGYNCASLKRIQSHESAAHGRPASLDVNCKATCLQTFFQGTQIRYFQVLPPSLPNPEDSLSAVRTSRATNKESARPPTPNSSVSSSGASHASTALPYEDLRLMHQYTFATASTLYRGNEDQDFWTQHVPQYACSQEYLMRGVLMIAAAHLAHVESSNRTEWTEVAMGHETIGIELFRAAISQEGALDGNAIMSFSRLMAMYHCAAWQIKTLDMLDDSDASNSALFEYLYIHRGGCAVMRTRSKDIKIDVPFTCLHRIGGPSTTGCSRPHPDGLPYELGMVLADLGSSLKPMVELVMDPVDFDAISNALGALHASFCKISQSSRCPTAAWDALDHWPNALSDRFCEMVTHKSPVALVIYAHYCVILHYVGRKHWFVSSHGKFLLETITVILDGDPCYSLLTWPRAQIGSN